MHIKVVNYFFWTYFSQMQGNGCLIYNFVMYSAAITMICRINEFRKVNSQQIKLSNSLEDTQSKSCLSVLPQLCSDQSSNAAVAVQAPINSGRAEGCKTLHTAHFSCPIAHCTLRTAHCTVHTEHCTLNTAHFSCPTAHCTLHTAH